MRADVNGAGTHHIVLCARLFYVLMHLLVFGVFFMYPNDLVDGFSEISGASYTFMLLKAVAVVLFFSSHYNPGYLRQFPIGTEFDHKTVSDWEPPQQRFCEFCQLLQPYRTKHCKKCEECVLKYDHHCFWIGSCVGEGNHFRFVCYLCVESVCLLWAAYNCLSGLKSDLEAYGGFIVAFLVSAGFGILVTGLAGYHLYLISVGATTWELWCREKIDYMHSYPPTYNPFNEGLLQNWKTAMCPGDAPKAWVPPKPLAVYPFNWCENEYWSCC